MALSFSTDTLDDTPLPLSGKSMSEVSAVAVCENRAECIMAANHRFHRTAFCCWMLANILFFMPVVLYAGYMMMATATFIFLSMASFSTIMYVPRCVFSIGTVSFETEYSHSFFLALATGTNMNFLLIISYVFVLLKPSVW